METLVSTMYTHGMKAVIQKWGNSLAIRIPKAFTLQLGMTAGKEVDMKMEQNGLHISPAEESLEELLAKITPENLHGETLTGVSVGREIW